jgi:hypothetical protein
VVETTDVVSCVLMLLMTATVAVDAADTILVTCRAVVTAELHATVTVNRKTLRAETTTVAVEETARIFPTLLMTLTVPLAVAETSFAADFAVVTVLAHDAVMILPTLLMATTEAVQETVTVAGNVTPPTSAIISTAVAHAAAMSLPTLLSTLTVLVAATATVLLTALDAVTVPAEVTVTSLATDFKMETDVEQETVTTCGVVAPATANGSGRKPIGISHHQVAEVLLRLNVPVRQRRVLSYRYAVSIGPVLVSTRSISFVRMRYCGVSSKRTILRQIRGYMRD